ncbi:hypothetical protein GS057_002239 [Salmonella enterica]|nr:hypothetical protein [Salmonella enterica]
MKYLRLHTCIATRPHLHFPRVFPCMRRKVDRSRATPRSAARSGELFRDNLN